MYEFSKNTIQSKYLQHTKKPQLGKLAYNKFTMCFYSWPNPCPILLSILALKSQKPQQRKSSYNTHHAFLYSCQELCPILPYLCERLKMTHLTKKQLIIITLAVQNNCTVEYIPSAFFPVKETRENSCCLNKANWIFSNNAVSCAQKLPKFWCA